MPYWWPATCQPPTQQIRITSTTSPPVKLLQWPSPREQHFDQPQQAPADQQEGPVLRHQVEDRRFGVQVLPQKQPADQQQQSGPVSERRLIQCLPTILQDPYRDPALWFQTRP